MIQLLCGNIGMPGGGVNALRGHSNVQGITDVGHADGVRCRATWRCRPTPSRRSSAHLAKRTFTPLQAEPDQLLAELPQVLRQLPEEPTSATKATPENEFGYDWLPKLDVAYDA